MYTVLHYKWGEMAASCILPLCNAVQALMSSPDKDDQLFPLQESSRFCSNSLQLVKKKKKREKPLVWTRTKVKNNCALLMEIVGKTARKAVL